MDDNKLKITINLDGHDYRLVIDRSEEEDVRAAAKRVNTALNAVGQHFDNTEVGKNQLTTLVAYQLALDGIRAEKKADTKPCIDKIRELDQVLTDQLLTDYKGDLSFLDNKKEV